MNPAWVPLVGLEGRRYLYWYLTEHYPRHKHRRRNRTFWN